MATPSLGITPMVMNTGESSVENPVQKHLPWHQNARVMRAASTAFFTLTIVFCASVLAASIITACLIHPLCILGIAVNIILGVPLIVNSSSFYGYCKIEIYWKDPYELDRITKKIEKLSFLQIQNKYQLGDIYKYLPDAKEMMQGKFLEYVQAENVPYTKILSSYHQHKDLYNIENLRPIFLERLQTHSIKDLIKSEGKALFNQEEPTPLDFEEAKKKFNSETKGLSFEKLIEDYSWIVFRSGVADAGPYQDEVSTEWNNSKSKLIDLLEKYSSDIITQDVLPNSTPGLKEKFIEMMETELFSTVAKKYGVLFEERYKLVPEEWRKKVDQLDKIYKKQCANWKSPDLLRAENRYNSSSNTRTIEIDMDTSEGNYITGSFDNPNYFSRTDLELERKIDKTTRLLDREGRLVNNPWRKFLDVDA